jgi:invasion protein IalB
MHPRRHSLLLAAALGLAAAAPVTAQDTAAPTEAPAAAESEPAADAAAPETTAAEDETAAEGEAEAAPAEAAEPAQPQITTTRHGDWEVGCLEGTTNCEMQQLALDTDGNPVILARVVRLPAGSEAEGLAIFNTPLGTLLQPGLGFQIDSGERAALPFEWCVQEGCIVRLGLRSEDVAAMKRGRAANLTVASIAAPDQPLTLTLSLSGFTAAYDSMTAPTAAPSE